MTVRELSKLYYLDKLIAREEEKLENLRAAVKLKPISLTGMPHASSVNDKIGSIVPDIVDTERMISSKRDEYAKALSSIMSYIASIDDPRIKLIIELRFVDKMSWNEVADEIGDMNSEDSVKKLCYRYLKSHT